MNKHSSRKILIIDDDAMIRWTLTKVLQEWGYSVIEAETSNEGLEQFEQVHPVAVLLDIGLPDGSGLDLLREIKHRCPQTAVILMTGEVIVENTIAALRGGADDFVGKPIHLDELQYALRGAIKNQRLRKRRPILPRLLVVTDSQARANHLMTGLRISDIEVTVAITPAELLHAIEEEHDLAVIDVEAKELRNVLAALRTSPPHAEIPILVEISRIVQSPNLSGVFPQYRAMPCSPTELIALARRRLTAMIPSERNQEFTHSL